jgi:fibronectin type 3 domain-containing protein
MRRVSMATAAVVVVLVAGGGAGAAPAPTALQLNGSSQYVTFGAAPGLGVTQFTLETWFKRTGAGVGTGTGTGGITSAIPLITKGRAEAETPANLNMNYFLGIDVTSGRLVADYEDTAGGANHPVTGTTVVTSNVWHHAAVTFSGTALTLYLDGVAEGTVLVTAMPESTSIQHAALGTALNSTGVAAGFFQGILDEARIWNVARSALEISGSRNQEITSAPGLIARWGLNEGAGATIGDSTGNLNVGTAANSPTWSTDVPTLTAAPAWNSGLYLGGASGYVTFGAAPSLAAAQFTLETWFKRTGTGVGTSTGAGGVTSAVPLVTKGRAEAEGSNVDMNYFLGIDTATNKLAVDFEEGASGASPGLNHPLIANTVITNNVWHHAAATYDGQTWKLYLDGALDGSLVVGQPPRSDSIQHAALGTAMTSTGAAAGFFQGVIDEARIWNYARSQAQIQATKDFEVSSGSGVVGRWGLNEGGGTSAATSFGTANGTVVNAGWVAGAPVSPGGDATPPAQPQGLTATPGNGSVSLGWNANTDTDLRGYNLYRSTSTPVSTSGTPLNGATALTSTSYVDNGVTNGTTYYYTVVAVDNSWNTSAPSAEASATPQGPPAPHALEFNGANQYVTMGQATSLDAAQFTLETWFKRTGAGVGTSTGTGGVTAVPLITKGRAEAETPANLNMNYFLGIDPSSGVLVADFEDTAGGGNHPVSGTTVISQNVWHHASATFDGSYWRLYLDGVLDAKLAVSATPESTSIQHAALAAAMTSTGAAAGFFQGDLDEARIWNYARTGVQIRSSRNSEITSASGLLARFGMNEGSGTTVTNSAGSPNGTAVGGPTWIEGYGFPQDTTAPAAAQNLAAAPDDSSANLTWTANGEADLAGYNLYRSTSSPVSTGGTPVNGIDLIRGTSYTDTGLTNGTTYYYVLVAVDGSNNSSAASSEASVTPAPGDPVFVGAGDIADCSRTQDMDTAAVISGMPNASAFTIGDNAYPNGTATDFTCYDATWGAFKNRTRPALGNHDYANGASSADGYFDYFNGAGNFTGPAGDRDKGYYSYDVGDYWHVVVLNSECYYFPVCNTATQEQWLRSDLAAHASRNVIAITHRPRWSSGPSRPGLTTLQPFWQALYDYGADLVLVGHDHQYERFAPQDDAGQADPEFGVREIIVGTGGAALSSLGATVPNSEVRNNDTYGVLKLTLHQSNYNWQFIRAAGGTFTDSGSQATHAAPPNAPPTATVSLTPAPPKTNDTLTATATKSDADGQQVSLTFVWKVNGTTKRTFTSASALTDTFNLATAGNGDRGDVVRVEVTPNDGIVDGTTASDQVTVANSAPVLSQDLQDRTDAEGDAITLPSPATDADSDTLTYGATNLPPGLSINTSTGTISGTIAAGAVSGSPYAVSVTATDGTATATDTFSWTVTHTNTPPVVDTVTIDQSAPRTNDTLTVTVTAHDADGDQLTYAYQWTKNGVDISGATASTLNLATAGNGDKGDAIAVRVTANDGHDDSGPKTSAPVTVVNSDPQFNQDLGDRSDQEGATVSVSASATDADADPLTYTATGLPPGLSIDVSSGLISGTISETAAEGSPYSVTITVRDGPTVDATDTFTWTVTPLPPAAPQGLTAVAGDGSVSLNWTANSEPDLAGYNVYRSTSSPVQTTTPLNGTLLTSPNYADNNVVNYTTYYYVVKAVDTSGAASPPSNEASATPHAAQSALQFNGSNQYVTMGSASSLGATTLTLETWFRRTGAGAGTSTGTGGVTAVPLITKGRAEAETPANLNMNYFLGIDASTGVLVADFEDTTNGGNHPVTGSTLISQNVWHHAAATFDGSYWRLYLDGVLDAKTAVSATPQSSSIQHAALASALTSTGAPAGFFQGQLDEARIWNYARTGVQIRGSRDSEIGSAPGLVVRFGLNEGAGTTADNSAGSPDGTLVNGPAWVSGYGFPEDGTAPAAPSGFSASAGDGSISLSWTANTEADLAGYDLYRSTSTPVDTSGTPLNGADLLRTTTYVDSGLTNGTTYYYALVAVDGSNNRSAAATASGTPRPASHALEFNGSSQYVTMGQATSLNAAQFTLETWFRRTGAGVGTSTGSGGIASAVPLVTKGRAEAETPANLNMNYFLGIDSSTGALVADFEDTAGGGNHPVTGSTVVTQNVWHHAAATFDGSYWRLYLDGVLDAKLAVSATPESTSIQHAALASALTSSGAAAGFFQGDLDEARIWNYAREGAQVRSARNSEITSAAGLLGRFGMNEGSGTTVGNSAGSLNGTTVGSPAWIDGYGFPQDTSAPAAPQGLAASPDDATVNLSWSGNGEPDLAGYNLYRSTSSPVSTAGTPVNGTDLIRGTSYTDGGLINGTTYYYVLVAIDGSDNRSPASNEASATPTAGDPVLVGAGDIAVCGSSNDEATADVLDTMPSAAVFTIGDNAYDSGLLTEFNSCYAPSWGRAGIKPRTRPAAGNHDYGNGNNNGEGYFDYFNGAGNFTGPAGDRDKGYYSYDVGDYWHVVVLNSECGIDASCSMTSQEAWLRDDLAANDSKNVIGMLHRPRWTSGPTRPGDARQQPLWEALYDYGADLVLAGHDHDYERFAPQNANGQLDTTYGVREIIVGTGGASLSGFGTVAANSEVRNNNTWGVLKLTLHQSSYDWRFIRASGGTFTDAGTQATHGAPSLAPVVDSVAITPTSPLTNDTLTATVTAHDPNGDPITLAYQWTRNGVDIAGATASTLNLATAGNGNKGDSIAVRVTASDGTLTSAPRTSSAVTVQNSPPTATVTLSTHNPSTNAVLTATASKADADADTVTLTFVWTVNGTVRKTTANSSALTDTFDLSQPGNGDAGDVVRVEVTPNDGTASGATASDEATVDATAPAAPSGLSAAVSSTAITLDWADNGEPDLAGYNVYRAISGQPTFTKLNGALLTASTYRDTTAAGGQTYDYRVTAVDTSANESQPATATVFRGIAFRAASSGQATNATSLTLTRPSGTTTGDGLLAAIDVRSGTTITAPAGWALVRSDSSGSTLKQSVYVKVAGAGEPASYAWSFSGSQSAAGSILAYAGVHASSPIAASGGGANPSSTSITAPSVTTGVTDTLLVGLFGTATNATITQPSDMAEQAEVAAGGKQKLASEAADAYRQAAGATGPRTATASSAAVNIGQLVALRPVGAPAGGDTEPPTIPTNLAATAASSTQIDLTWTASTDNVAVDHYAIYRNGTQVGTSTVTHFSDTGLTPNTQYTYTVEAFDASGNGSGQSDPATTTTLPPATGGITFRAASSASSRAGTSLAIARPTGTQSGDVLLASLDVAGAPTLTPPAGWTLVRTDTAPGSFVKATYWHLAAATDPASFTWTLSSSQVAVGLMLAYAGVDSANPIDASNGQANASSTSAVAPSVTVSTAGSMLVMLVGLAGNGSVTPPSGMTERAEAAAGRSAKITGEASDATVGAGTTGTRTATASRAGANVGQLVALRKAP